MFAPLSRLRARSRSGKNNTLCCFLRPSRRFATHWRRLFVCSHKLVGVGVLDDPCLWESNFAYGKSQRLLRRSHRRCRSSVLHRLASPRVKFVVIIDVVCTPRKILRSYAEGITSLDGAEPRFSPTANAPSTRHPERAPARRSFGSAAKRNGQNLHNVQGSTKKSALTLKFKDIFSYYLGFCEKEN